MGLMAFEKSEYEDNISVMMLCVQLHSVSGSDESY